MRRQHRFLVPTAITDRKQRLQAIGEARILLENPDGTEVAPEAESLPHGKLAWVIASIVTLALAAVSCGHSHKPPPPAPQAIQTTIDAPPKTRITNFAISPDGRYLAMIMSTTGERGAQLWVRPFESLQAQALAGTEGASLPFWSPDSRYIGFFAGGDRKST